MSFKPDAKAAISTIELANRDATYMLVTFKEQNQERGLVFGKATSSGGLHAEQHFDAWCRAPDNLATLQAAIHHAGNIVELLLTKSPCGSDDKNCAETLISLTRFLNGPQVAIDHVNLLVVGMHKGIHNANSKVAMKALLAADPLIRLYAWDPGADPFSATDEALRAVILQFDNSANPRRGTDVDVRLRQVTQYMHDGLGLRHARQASDDESAMEIDDE